MQRFIPTIPILVAGALVALFLAGQGGARSAELVRCSSTTQPLDSLGRSIDLTGTWNASDKQLYYLRQVGSCLWWTGSKPGRTGAGSYAFFGTVYSSKVVGAWADVRTAPPRSGTSGQVTLSMTSGNGVLLPRSTSFPVKYLRKNP